VSIETRVCVGRPAAVLLDEGQSGQMIILGSRGFGDFVGLVLGSTSLQVAMHAHTPVVVVRHPSWALNPGPSAGRVVVGIDGSETSQAAIGFAFDEADSRKIGLTAVHTWKWAGLPPSAQDDHSDSAAEDERCLLARQVTRWRDKYPGVDVIKRTVRAGAALTIIAESAGAALTVVGSRGVGGFKGLLLGSVSHAVLHYAGSPVAVVRTAGVSGDHASDRRLR
jgi:nucleotide-binding universal stress UspA family protein